ncbi:bromodomain adjacent to zinc finger domain protein 2B-like [Arapaima gigas]
MINGKCYVLLQCVSACLTALNVPSFTDMESGERLSRPSSTSPSLHTPPPGAALTPNPSSKSLGPDAAPLGSAATSCGPLFQTGRDQPFSMTAVSSAFPFVGHPAFGLYTTSSGRAEFGGLGNLGTLGVTPALAAHPQLGAYPEWWRTAEAHGRGVAAFFPPLLGLPPLFSPSIQNHTPSTPETRTLNRNGQDTPTNTGLNGSVNGSTASATSEGRSLSSTPPILRTPEQKKTSSRSQGCGQANKKSGHRAKDKKQSKEALGACSNSESDTGSHSDTSSEAASSAESEDLEDDEDDEEDVQSIDSDDSDSGKESQVKRKVEVLSQVAKCTTDGPKVAVDKKPQGKNGSMFPSLPTGTHDPAHPEPPSPPLLGPTPPGPLQFQSSKAAAEAFSPHRSVIQATGLAARGKPLALLMQSSDEGPPMAPPSRPTAPSPGPPTLSPSCTKPGGRSLLDEALSQIDFTLKQEQFKQVFPALLRKQQELHKAQKKMASTYGPPPHLSPETPGTQSRALPRAGVFLADTLLGSNRTNGIAQSDVQDAPLALVTKPLDRPVNLSVAGRTPPPAPLPPAGAVPPSGSTPRTESKGRASRGPASGGGGHRSHLVKSLVELFRGVESDIPSNKDSDDSAEEEEEEDDDDDDDEDDDDDDDEEDSDDSLSDSEMNFGSSSDGSEDNGKRMNGASAGMSPQKKECSDDCSPLDLQVVKAVNRTPSSMGSSPGASASQGAPCSSIPACRPPGAGKRKRPTSEGGPQVPLEFRWPKEARIGTLNGCRQEDVVYYGLDGKKLRQYPNFMKWSLLEEQEVIPHILAMGGRSSRPLSSDRRRSDGDSQARRKKGRPPNVGEGELSNSAEAKLLRKLEAQEIARQAAQAKLMRKLEKQALAQAAKEAKKQQAIMAAEEKRKQKEQIKILKQQEKIKRIQQIRMEKELRAQQILEEKRRKKEEAANAKILEAEKRTKEKEMRRQQAVMLKHQVALTAHLVLLPQERERRRQHMMLMKAVEARKKAEERERLKQEKRDEKRLNKERKLELRRLEMEMAKELNKPNEDMCLADHKPLPELSRVPGLVLPDPCFANCLLVLHFLRSFGKVLGLDLSVDVPSLGVLQEGLLNVGNSGGRVQDLLVRLLSAAVCDPGLPSGHRARTTLGDQLTSLRMNRDNVSEALQLYLEAHCGHTHLAPLAQSLRTKAFQAHTPAQKAAVFAFLVNELACSKSVVSEIDKNIDQMTNLRRDKLVIEGSLRKLKTIHAKKTGKKESVVAGEALGTPTASRKRKRKGGDSEDEDDDDDDDSEDQAEDEDADDDDGKKGKKVETCEEEDDGDQAASVEELEKQIDKLTKQQNQIRRKLFEASHSLRSMTFGQDRYRRRYWVLPQCGAIFVEGLGSREGGHLHKLGNLNTLHTQTGGCVFAAHRVFMVLTCFGSISEELEREYELLENLNGVQVKEEPVEDKPLDAAQDVTSEGGSVLTEEEAPSPNLFLQNPGSSPKLGKLLGGAGHQKQNGLPEKVATTAPSPTCRDAQTVLPSSPPMAAAVPHPRPPVPAWTLQPGDQLFRMLTEKSGSWFCLLPRSPCDDTSLTMAPSPLKSPPQPSSSSSPTHPAGSASPSSHIPTGLNSLGFSAFQVKPGLQLLAPPFCLWPAGMMGSNLPLPCSSTSPALGAGCPSLDGVSTPLVGPLGPGSTPIKSESPPPSSENHLSAPSPAVEVSKPQDYPNPQPIPDEMLRGWWKVTDVDELQALVDALHCRGVREKNLQKQLQKYMEFISQAYSRNREATLIDMTDLEENQVTEEALVNWCIEEQAMEVDISILQQVEELERRVTSASLQVKGWIHPEPQSEREDLVYHEHKPSTELSTLGEAEGGAARDSRGDGVIVRRFNNPLDIAVTRLAELEKNIERRYLESPLGCTVQIRLDSVGTVTVPAPTPSSSADGDGDEEDVSPGLKVWRKALSEVRSAAQLALCIQHLQRSIAWERSIMKVYCQICHKGDNEDLLLLCDGCDKGCHTYCHKPKMAGIPEGDWFCPDCISKASGQSPKNKKPPNRGGPGGSGGGKKTPEGKRNRKLPVVGDIPEDDTASTSSTPKKGAKDSKKKKECEKPPAGQPRMESPCTKKVAPPQDNDRDLAFCSILLAELEGHHDAWPFLTPVDFKSVPGYRKVIKKPMDFSTIREKLCTSQYQNLETFIIDVNLVFDNCEKFNEDNSEIGRAGHNMRRFFEKRWMELLKMN